MKHTFSYSYPYILILLLLASCYENRNDYTFKYDEGTFPEVPVNLEVINSVYDDYNAAYPYLDCYFDLCFSTNRNSKGQNFDIIYLPLNIAFDRDNGELIQMDLTGDFVEDYPVDVALSRLNTEADELGPNLILPNKIGCGTDRNFQEEDFADMIFLYSSGEKGSQDIKFLHNRETSAFSEPVTVIWLASEKDDTYPTLTEDQGSLYFCSDREVNFNIYQVALDPALDLLGNLENEQPKPIIKNEVLSSDYDDKCPYIYKDIMVFTSNRPGGYGGFDLYYAVFENGSWSAPVNFGDKINSAYDEYRPVFASPQDNFTNDILLFSSNRPGGLGGFDLYYVGVNLLTGRN